MPCLGDLDKGQGSKLPDAARAAAVHLPILIRAGVPVGLALPVQCRHPPVVAQPVTNEVKVTRVDHGAHAICHHLRNDGVKVVEPVSNHVCVHIHVAAHPLAVSHSQGLACGGHVEELVSVREVVAQLPLAFACDVVHVDTRVGAQHPAKRGHHADLHREATRPLPAVLVTELGSKLAEREPELDAVAKPLADQVVHQGIVRVSPKLDLRLCEAIPDGDTLQVDVRPLLVLIGQPDTVGNSGHVVTRITLSGDKEWQISEFRVSLVEGVEEVEHVLPNTLFVVYTITLIVTVAEARVDGLVHEDHVVVTVPAVLRLSERHVVVDGVGAVLVEYGQLATAARTPSHPQNHRIVSLPTALEVKVEHSCIMCAVQLEVSCNSFRWINNGHAVYSLEGRKLDFLFDQSIRLGVRTYYAG
mmetsp:Transcript_38099/g.84883  ORF Transcript_38099/g.84883 Transcript_38099/m.84883 type:complete len:415 (+) Transcript_38099:469-1713(+)